MRLGVCSGRGVVLGPFRSLWGRFCFRSLSSNIRSFLALLHGLIRNQSTRRSFIWRFSCMARRSTPPRSKYSRSWTSRRSNPERRSISSLRFIWLPDVPCRLYSITSYRAEKAARHAETPGSCPFRWKHRISESGPIVWPVCEYKIAEAMSG